MVTCNITLTEERIEEDPLFGKVIFHHVGLVASAAFGLFAIIIALFLMIRHATHYSKPWQQKHIIRILFMIPMYSMVSFLSYLYYRHAIYFEVIRDCYEAFAIASFFALLCNYIAENLHDQKEYFRSIDPKNWLWPLTWVQKCTGGRERGILRIPKSGLTWFNIIWIGVFQYCLIRVFFTIVSVLSQATGRYCEASLHPAFAHIWVMVFEGAAVTVAMYCLIQFYFQLRHDLAQYRPFLKILCIKLVIFFSFWQSLLISFLTSSGAIKASKTLAYPDIKIGIPSMLLCIEMAIFAVLHIFAFSWKEYIVPDTSDPYGSVRDQGQYQGGRFGLKAFGQAFNPWDIIKAAARGLRWLFVGVRKRKQDISYQTGTKLNRLDSGDNSYQGPTFAGNGEPAITTVHSHGYQAHKLTPYGSAEDDRAGLLSNAQANPYVRQGGKPNIVDDDKLPSNPTPAEEERADFDSPQKSSSARPPQNSQDQWSQQQSYGGGQHQDWNMFGGVSNTRPPPPGRPER